MIITVTGQNDYLRSRELRDLQTKFVQAHADSGVERVAGEEVELGRLLDSLQAQSLFASERFVVVRDLSVNKAAIAKIDDILAAVSDGVTLVLHEPNLDMRTSYAKTLQKQTDWRKFDMPRDYELIDWVQKTVAAEGGAIDKVTAEYLVQRVGANQQQLANDVEKLLAYQPQIIRETVELLSTASPQSSIFDLLAAAFNGETAKALNLYKDQREQGVEPQAILSMTAWQLHALITTKLGGKRNPNDIAKAAGLSPYVVRNAQPLARQLSLDRLKQLAQAVIDLEITMKSQAINVDDAVETLVVMIANK